MPGRLNNRIRVAWFSPLNVAERPGPSRAAYVSDLLLPLLSQQFEIELFHNSFLPYRSYRTHHFLTACERHRAEPFDIFFYQLEDARSSYFTRMHLALLPGIVLFHDFVMHDFGPEPILNSSWEPIVRKYRGLEPRWPEREAEHPQKGPHAVREAAWSLVPLFVSEKDHAEYRRMVSLKLLPEGPSYYLPYPVSMDPQAASGGASGDIPRLAYAGRPGVEDRASQVLKALSLCDVPLQLCWLVSDASEERIARELIEDTAGLNVEFFHGRSPDAWSNLVGSCRLALHPFFSVYGQVGPYLQISLSRGVPCLVTDFGASEYLPDHTVWKVRPGASEVSEILEIVRVQLGFPDPRGRERSAALALEQFDTRVVAEELASVFTHTAAPLRRFHTAWEAFERSAREAVLAEVSGGPGSGPELPELCRPAFKELGWWA